MSLSIATSDGSWDSDSYNFPHSQSATASPPDADVPSRATLPLRDPEDLVAAYFRSSTIGFNVLDPNCRYLAINDALARINGVSAQEHLGKTPSEVLGHFGSLVETDARQVFATGEPRFDVHSSGLLEKRGHVGHWVCHMMPLKNDAGEVTRVCSIVVGVPPESRPEQELQNAAPALRREADRFKTLLEVSGVLASNWNVQQVFAVISARIRRVLHHEYAGFALHDSSSGLLVRQAEDFPLSKGLVSSVQISAHNSPEGRALEQRSPIIYSQNELRCFDAEIAKGLLAEGIKSLCCVPLLRPTGPLGVLVVGSTRNSAFEFEDATLLSQIAAQLALAIENHLAAAEIADLRQRLSDERKYLEGDHRPRGPFKEIVGESPALMRVLHQLAIVAESDATVLILGETGTGKELFARAIHRMSLRHDRSFIKVNCAAIPTGLLESELFGHEKGAFTGAVSRKIGRMELADGGTLFLDEVGEIPLELQPKLLRVLQDQEFERLGSTRTLKVNLRLVAATNRDLVRGVAERQFRSDLFYRINVFPIRVPALRERSEDIPLLVRYFVRQFAIRMKRHIETIPRETMKALAEWSWPGNVRELENLMERSVILSDGPILRVPLWELRGGQTGIGPPNHTLDNAEREHILRVLRETGGVLSGPDGAAHRLGLKRTTLQSKMQRLKITREDYLSPPE